MMLKIEDIAITVFTYNRSKHTQIILEHLSKNKNFSKYRTFIFSDGPRQGAEDDVEDTREVLKNFEKEHSNVSLLLREKNLGCGPSIISGVNLALESYKAVIVIEDDIRVSPIFLEYMFLMLNKYEDDEEIACITGFIHPSNIFRLPKSYNKDVFLIPRTNSAGWGTWKAYWENCDWELKDFDEFMKDKRSQNKFNIAGEDLTPMLKDQKDGNIDAWDIQWTYHNFKNNWLTVYPAKSYVENIGHDGTGMHSGNTNKYANKDLNNSLPEKFPSNNNVDKKVLKIFKNMYGTKSSMFKRKILRQIKKTIKTFKIEFIDRS